MKQPSPKSNSKSITRRRFLMLAGATLGGCALVCGGLTFAVARQPNLELIQTSCGGDSKMNGKILVAYATKSGATGEIAQAIGKRLCDRGAAVDVKPVQSIANLDGYRAVILGSAIRMGSWLPEAIEFAKKNQGQLNQLPTAFFTVHLLHLDDSLESQTTRAAYTEPARKIVTPKTETFFAGRLEYAKLSLLERLISSMMKAPEQDLRDWAKIGAWAESAYPALEAA